MLLEAVWISFAFILGFFAKSLKLPNLVGYLIAGFVIAYVSQSTPLPSNNYEILNHISHLGIILLLFTIGLKLNFKSLASKEVFGVGMAHFLITVGLLTPVFYYGFSISLKAAVLISIALSFSSTVLSAKTLESKKELKAFHGRMALGILIIQDILALFTISVSTAQVPSIWALGIFLLPLIRPLLFKILDHVGRDELFVLFGVLLAISIGGFGFESVGLSAELGALIMGFLISGHARAGELSKSLWSLKEFFLVGFFLKIGMAGLPTLNDLYIALGFMVILPIKSWLFFKLLLLFKLRARSSFLAALSLTAFSEFGLIVSDKLLPEWTTALALTVAMSFIISSPLNSAAHLLYEKICNYLIPQERKTLHPDEQPIYLKDSQVLVMGLGRAGTAAYEELEKHCVVTGMDSDPEKVKNHQQQGRNVFYADAEDHNFWGKLYIEDIKAVILAMDEMPAQLNSIEKLRQRDFKGKIVTNCLYKEDYQTLIDAGADIVHLTMVESGVSLAREII